MELEKTLEHYGLEEKEAIVYLTCLQLGKDTAFRIAQRAELKRSTVYVMLKNLNIKGLIAVSKTTKATLYEAASPKKLLQQIKFRKHQLEESLPLLLALYKDNPDKPHIQVLEGETGVAQVYQESIEWMGRNKELLAFGSLAHCVHEPFKRLLNEWVRTMRDRHHHAREIPQVDKTGLEYIRKVKQNRNQNHHVRVVPEGTFANDNLIYGDTVAIISAGKSVFVTLIQSRDIAYSYRNFFELAWKSASRGFLDDEPVL